MAYSLLLLLSIITIQLKAADQVPQQFLLPQQYFVFNHTTSADNQIMFTNQTNVQQQSYLTNTSTTIQNVVNQTRDQAQEYAYGIFSWIGQNRTKSVACIAVAGYGYVWYKLASLNYALLNSTNWSHWHDTVTLEELLAKPQQEVATNLLTAIQRQYSTPEQFDDLIGPLIAFVRDVDIEIAQLRQLVQLHIWIDRLRISFLFPKQTALRDQSHDAINRLTYLKNLLLNWVSQHKVARLATVHASS